jgi:hypothetical protein
MLHEKDPVRVVPILLNGYLVADFQMQRFDDEVS